MPKHVTYAQYYVPLAPGTLIIEEPIYSGLNLAEYLGFPTEAVEVYVTILPNVVVQSNDASKAAISSLGLPAGSTIQINNFGFIIGSGGRGGSRYDLLEDQPVLGEDGQPGGDAVYSHVPIRIASAFGKIWGGGGGAGGLWTRSTSNSPVDTFQGGRGGAGRGPNGGGDSGVGDIFGADAIPFESSAVRGGPAPGYVPPPTGNLSHPTGDYVGSGGDYGKRGEPSFYGISSSVTNPNTGSTSFFVTHHREASGGEGGYSVNVSAGVPLTWLDNALDIIGNIKGSNGTRDEAKMPYLARLNRPITVHINSDRQDFNLFQELGAPADPVNVYVRIDSGITLSASNTQYPAFSTAGMPAGSTLFMKTRGRIIGRGGDGGSEAAYAPEGTLNPELGRPGGDAMHLTIPTVIALPILPTQLHRRRWWRWWPVSCSAF